MFAVERIIDSLFLLIYLSAIRKSGAEEEYYLSRTSPSHLLIYKIGFTLNLYEDGFEFDCSWVVRNTESFSEYYFHGILEPWAERGVHLNIHKEEDYKYFEKRHALTTGWVTTHPIQSSASDTEPGNIIAFSVENYHHEPGDYRLCFLDYPGSLEYNLRGFYSDIYPDEEGRKIKFLTTQFGPFGARYAFPVRDEPYFRAQFKIIIIRPQEYTCVISNAELKNSTPKGDLIEDEFAATKNISPSSVSFTVSKMQVSSTTSFHRIVARPEIIEQNKHEYVADLVNRIYNEVEDILKIGCELEYLYHVTLPSNKMKFESLGTYWGVNHYKENVLIISKHTKPEIIETSTIAIGKLIAQQWFLSYLMVDSWTLAWVNEGLSNYLSYNITNKFYPDWIISERLMSQTRMAMQEDSQCCCISINSEARKPSEIEGKFNIITVYKGTALITMMERLIPPIVFQEGIKNLIEKKKWITYTPDDLYEAMDYNLRLYNHYDNLNLPKKLPALMSSWENQMGYPVLTVTRNYDAYDLETVSVSQMRFYFNKLQRKATWPVPINYVTRYYPNFKNTRPTDWITNTDSKITIDSLKDGDWLILNIQATYYYRINYDEKNWKLIAEQLLQNHTVIHRQNRMQIIDDAFSLAEFGMLNYETPLLLCEYIKKEREYGPLAILKEAAKAINKKLSGSTAYEKFKEFIKRSVEYIYDEFLHNLKPELNIDSEGYHRNHRTLELLFDWVCDLKSTKCETTSFKLQNNVYKQLPNYFEKHALCNRMHKADEKEWTRLFDQYVSLRNITSQNNMFNALGCSKDRGLQERFLNYVKNAEKDKLMTALESIIHEATNGTIVALNFISNNIQLLLDVFISKDVKDILKDIGSRITDKKQLDVLIDFSKRHAQYSALIAPALSIARQNIEWRKDYLSEIGAYLAEKHKSSATKLCFNVHATVLIISYYVNLIILG